MLSLTNFDDSCTEDDSVCYEYPTNDQKFLRRSFFLSKMTSWKPPNIACGMNARFIQLKTMSIYELKIHSKTRIDNKREKRAPSKTKSIILINIWTIRPISLPIFFI